MLRTKPKKTVNRQPKFMDEKFTGPEPVWTDANKWSPDKLRQEITHALYFYNYYMSAADMRKYVVEFGQTHLKWGKSEIAAFGECEDSRVGITIGSVSKMILNGCPMAIDAEFITNKIAELLAYGNARLAEKKQVVVIPVAKRNVQDHLRDKLADTIGDLEVMFDALIDGDTTTPDFMAYFREQNMPQAFVARIREKYAEQYAELLEGQDKKGDACLREAYAWMTKPVFKRYDAWYKALFDALTTYGVVKSAIRKTRKAKPISKDKLVRNVKYLKQFDELNLVSVPPTDIIGATTLWCYDTKTRKLIVYYAAVDAKQLSIKGSTIIGYDEKSSIAKMVRKPIVTMKEFMNAGKVKLRTFMDDLTTTPTLANGRINANQVLLKVF
jgi:hypothetical protein